MQAHEHARADADHCSGNGLAQALLHGAKVEHRDADIAEDGLQIIFQLSTFSGVDARPRWGAANRIKANADREVTIIKAEATPTPEPLGVTRAEHPQAP